jgi:hypothetical protein
MIQQIDYLAIDLANLQKTKNYFNLIAYTPAHIQGNFAAAYEYCNGYIYVVQMGTIFSFDFGYLSELGTRLSMLFSKELQPFLNDMQALLKQNPTDWYLVGFRWGLLWQLLFDVKLTS